MHKATLKDGQEVAVKVQYPGISLSIRSDLANLKSLLNLGSLLPKGLYLDNTIRVAASELEAECDYIREADSMVQFAALLDRYGLVDLKVPRVFQQHCSKNVLVSEFCNGFPIGEGVQLSQTKRDQLGHRLLNLALHELFLFRMMQTDPNWSNFLYDPESDKIVLLDFGATRSFPKSFTDKYMNLLRAGAQRNRQEAIHWSRELGFLTGLESEVKSLI